ncbi:unnamed protein product [Amoebophrya sp. A25]|nr:unnamed protein product [Amoebophrya sp. A25]|eukprot:GSA25T00003807001.1
MRSFKLRTSQIAANQFRSVIIRTLSSRSQSSKCICVFETTTIQKEYSTMQISCFRNPRNIWTKRCLRFEDGRGVGALWGLITFWQTAVHQLSQPRNQQRRQRQSN